jgi:hypothetical protein
VTPAIAHRHHCRPSQSCRCPAVRGAVAAVAHCDALLSCNLASPLDAPPPLHMPAGCHVGLVVIASSLVTPPPLKRRLVVHVTSQCTTRLFAPAGCCITSPLPPPLNVPACCHLASHHATLLFAPPGCPVTPRRATTFQHELSTSNVNNPSSSLSSLSSPFVVACCAGHKPPSTFDAPVDGWLLCPLSPLLFPVNFDATPSPLSQRLPNPISPKIRTPPPHGCEIRHQDGGIGRGGGLPNRHRDDIASAKLGAGVNF